VARFRIVPDRSAVSIEGSSSVHPIKTRTVGLEGYVDFDLQDGGLVDLRAQPRGELSLDVVRLSSGNPLEDREMRRRIDARRFPTIQGRLSEMAETEHEGRYRVRGEVTFRGVTRSHEDEMTVSSVDDHTVKLEGESTFDIRDFGMQPPRILMLRVHPEVTVRIEVWAERES
jgi:polyisoprenoid-binding protein YceI